MQINKTKLSIVLEASFGLFAIVKSSVAFLDYFSLLFCFFGSFSCIIYKHHREFQNAIRVAQPCRSVPFYCLLKVTDHPASSTSE